MELELSLGDLPAPVKANTMPAPATCQGEDHDDLALGLGVMATEIADQDNQRTSMETLEGEDSDEACPDQLSVRASPLPQTASANLRGFDVNAAIPVDGRASMARSSSPPSMHMEVHVTQGVDEEASEDEENGGTGRVRKKLRLSKEQSAFLEDSFKEHNTLTLEQKSRLANRLSLRPRQVEVWFQNRRARTKLKQTEADCEHLKRHCEALARENRKLQREVAELRAYGRAPYPPYNHHLLSGFSSVLPAAACPSCVAATHSTIAAVSSPGPAASTLFPRPRFGAFTSGHPVLRRQPSTTL